MMQLTCPTSINDKQFTAEYLKKSLVPVQKVLSYLVALEEMGARNV